MVLAVDPVVHTPGLVTEHEALLGLLAREVADVGLAPLEHVRGPTQSVAGDGLFRDG